MGSREMLYNTMKNIFSRLLFDIQKPIQAYGTLHLSIISLYVDERSRFRAVAVHTGKNL